MFQNIIGWVESVLGSYSPPTYDVYSVSGDTEAVIPSGLAGVDWRYIFTGILLCIVVWSVFRLLGVLLERLGGR